VSFEGLLFALVLVLTVGLWVAAPLWGDRSKAKNELEAKQKQIERLWMFYEQALSNIRDLEDDHATGKINAEDYQREREEWTQRGIALLKALDTLDADSIMTSAAPEAIDDAIESAVAAYRAKQQ
jgi:cytochrome c-type biogenesis protein CcmI